VSLFPIKHLQKKFLHVDCSDDRFEEETSHHVGVDGSQHGESEEEFGESCTVPTVNHFDIFIKCLVRLALQGLDVMLTLQPSNI